MISETEGKLTMKARYAYDSILLEYVCVEYYYKKFKKLSFLL